MQPTLTDCSLRICYCSVLIGHALENPTRISSANASLFSEMCQKMIVTQKIDTEIVLLKNPWDYGNEDVILSLFPAAKFVHLTRNPVEVINSMLMLGRHHSSMIQWDPYLWWILPRWSR